MTTSPINVSGHVETEVLETIEGEKLSQASGGYWNPPSGGAPRWGGWGGWGQPQYYTVQRGDNLTNIARDNGESLKRLLALNPQYRSNPNLIHPGEHVLTGRTYPRYY